MRAVIGGAGATPAGAQARAGSTTAVSVVRVAARRATSSRDTLATEEPLEIRLNAAGGFRTVSVTMRTPGHDFELAAGFLYGEGVVSRRHDLRAISYCVRGQTDEPQQYNTVAVDLKSGVMPDLQPLERHFFTSSACGVCGRAGLEALRLRHHGAPAKGPVVPASLLEQLPRRLRAAQKVFASTGGLHAAALFSEDGELAAVREDVGRHNALDKLVGWALLHDRLPLAAGVVLVSGRSSFEIMQKCLAAGARIVCAVSAPSSLAVSVAQAFDMTLVGFLRDSQFNIYAGAERIALCR